MGTPSLQIFGLAEKAAAVWRGVNKPQLATGELRRHLWRSMGSIKVSDCDVCFASPQSAFVEPCVKDLPQFAPAPTALAKMAAQ